MRKVSLLLLVILIVFGFISLLLLKPLFKPFVKINGQVFYVDVAKTEYQKEIGLGIYDRLPEKRGMVFPYSTAGRYDFWMKGMKFPIDIIYIKDDRIVETYNNLPNPKSGSEAPILVRPHQDINYVLEINAGLSDKYNIKPGDKIEMHL
jgi:uncharacterized membrane protein (UPF0127 family)